MLTDDEIARYRRHLVLKEIGGEGQQRLKAARVLVVGAGGLGSPLILYLAAAGIGRIGIIDDDRVSLDNLQRQVVHETGTIGRSKTKSAAATVERLNPHVETTLYTTRLVAENALDILRGYDIVADGSDNFATRSLVNDAVAGVIGSLQAVEVVKELLGIGEGLVGRLLLYDALQARFSAVSYAWDPENPLNGRNPRFRDLSHHRSGKLAQAAAQ